MKNPKTTILGLPQCGMFSKATAADLVLPRLLTGERVTPEALADQVRSMTDEQFADERESDNAKIDAARVEYEEED